MIGRGAVVRRRARIATAASEPGLIAATDIADLYVKRGMPFREAHGIVGGLVRTAVEAGIPLQESVEHLDAEARELLEQASWLESKASEGGTASARVRDQLDAARAALAAPPA